MCVFPIHYCGSIGYYQALLEAKSVVFETRENFIKQTHRNRMEIFGPNGIQKLVIPTMKTGSKRTMDKVRISYSENWQKNHWKSIETAYRSSPYFEFYEDQFRPYFTSRTDLLFDHCLGLHQTISSLLKLEMDHALTDEFIEAPEKDYRLDEFSLKRPTSYIQVFSDRHAFKPNLSILDALFCIGPHASELVKGSHSI